MSRPNATLRRLFVLVILLVVAVAGPVQAADHGVTVGVLAGVAGPVDGGAFNGSSVQLIVSYDYSKRQHLVLHIADLDLDDGLDNARLRDGQLRYVSLGTSFRSDGNFYDSGLSIGIGAYEQESANGLFDETAFGLHVGVDGLFEVTEHWGVIVELTGHWVDFSTESQWVTAVAGVGFRF
jgi:opacity protein-like surface antigen